MRCPRCDHLAADGARFCSNCGNPLALSCPSCATPYEAGANFCSNCGGALPGAAAAPSPAEAVAPSAAETTEDLARYVPEELLDRIRAARRGGTMRGERRTVTMLFADIQGSTAAAEHLDPEDWSEIMNGAFGRLIAPVYRYEGTLARLQGDAILAFFGAPIAHEDDPVRAVRAGLDIVRELAPYGEEVRSRHGVPIAVRVGVNTGLVVVGEVGSDLRVEYTALGDAINVAARMEQTAAPGTVQVTEETRRLLGDGFDTAPIGPVDVKGKREPVLAHRVLAFREDAGRRAAEAAPLIGRDAELDRLRRAVDRLGDGIGGILTLTGEAGVGKSRLLRALRDTVSEGASLATVWSDEGDLAWLHGQARSYERAVPHAAFVDLLCGWWAHDRSDDPGCFGRVAAAFERATGRSDEDTAGLLANLVRAPLPESQERLIDALSTPALHERTTAALTTYVAAEADRRPVVMIVDDLHWADDMSLTLVERLMDLTEAVPLLLLLAMRPNREDSSWHLLEAAARDHAEWHTAIDLDALSDDATDALLATLLGEGVAVDQELRELILEHANGNPLFLEELARSVDDHAARTGGTRPGILGRGQLEVPPSLRGLLTSRLDRLEEPTRHLAQVASVIGREFDLATLKAAVDDDTEIERGTIELVRRGILEERRRTPHRAYAFRHALIQETAYSTVLLRTRRELHARIARHLIPDDPDHARDADTHEIARHFLAAGDTAAAFPYLLETGRRATRAMALRDAITSFSTALESPPPDIDPRLIVEAHDGLGEAYSLVPDLTQAAATFQSLLDYGRTVGEPTFQVMALNKLGFSTAALAGDFGTAMRYLQDARRLAEEVGDDLGLAEYHMNACFVTSFQHDFDRAVEHDEEAARIGQRTGNEVVRLTGLVRKATNLVVTWRFDEARDAYAEAVTVARELDNEELLAILETHCAAVFVLLDGDVRRALEVLRPALVTLDRYASYYATTGHHRLGECAGYAGDVELALAAYAATQRYGVMVSQPFGVAAGAAGRARILASCGVTDDLAALRAQAVELTGTVAGEFYAPSVWADLGGARLAAGDLDGAAADLTTALGASGVTAQWERPRVLFGLARVALARGDLAGSHGALEQARSLTSTYGIRLHEPELFVLDGALAAAEGRDEDAVPLLTQAAATATEYGRVPVRIEATGRLAAVRSQQGDTTEAARLRERTEADIRDLANLIADESLRASFERTWRAGTAAIAAEAPEVPPR